MSRDDLEKQWVANEREIERIFAMRPLDREMHAKREHELLDDQDRIEFEIGKPSGGQRRWSGFR